MRDFYTGYVSKDHSLYCQTAVDTILEEIFQNVDTQMTEAYIDLAQQNSKLRGFTSQFFMHNGEIYPKDSKKMKVNSIGRLPTLHYSLFERIDVINNFKQTAGYTEIKNYVSAVVSASCNGIVLQALLPFVVWNAFQEKLPSVYTLVNDPPEIQEAIEVTQNRIEEIKKHFNTTIDLLREILMNKLLLQG